MGRTIHNRHFDIHDGKPEEGSLFHGCLEAFITGRDVFGGDVSTFYLGYKLSNFILRESVLHADDAEIEALKRPDGVVGVGLVNDAEGRLAAVAQAETIDLPRTVGEINIDGVLSEDAWRDATQIELSFENEPGENIPARVNTVAYLMEDGTNLYVGFAASDPDPTKIRAYLRDRDSAENDDQANAPDRQGAGLTRWAKRDLAITRLQEGYEKVNQLVADIQKHMADQSERTDRMCGAIEQLSRSLTDLPDISGQQARSLQAIVGQLDVKLMKS